MSDGSNTFQLRADHLLDLTDPKRLSTAAMTLMQLGFECVPESDRGSVESQEAARKAIWRAAFDSLGDRRASVVAEWIDRLFECFELSFDWHRRLEASFASQSDSPDFDEVPVFSTLELMRALCVARGFLDPHLERLVGLLREPPVTPVRMTPTARRDASDYCIEILAAAGPKLREFIPDLLNELRGRHGWDHAPKIADTLVAAARFDAGLVDALQSESRLDSPAGHTAIEVLRRLGAWARGADIERIAFSSTDPWKRSGAISALANLGDEDPKTLDCYAAALRDENAYVRLSALWAIGKRSPDPSRFVALLIEACDDDALVEDASMPDAAVSALAAYGPAAAVALPRLQEFLSGPLDRRTADPEVVREAIGKIARGDIAMTGRVPFRRRPTPVPIDEPIFPVILDGTVAYVDRTGAVVFHTPYEGYGEAVEFGPEGRAVVYTPGDASETFVIDRAGAVVFRSTWDRIMPYREGRAAIRQGDRWGFVDADGSMVVEPQYDSVTAFSEGLAGVELGQIEVDLGKGMSRTQRGRQGFIDRDGAIVIPIEIEHGVTSFHDGRAIVSIDGEMKPDLFNEEMLSFVPNRFGYIDRTGTVVIRCAPRTLASPFREGLATIMSEPRPWQTRDVYINRDGIQVIDEPFRSAHSFIDGCAVVRRPGRARRSIAVVIDPRGRELAQLKSDWFDNLGLQRFRVRVGEHYGIVDLSGRSVLAPSYDQITPFRNGLCWVFRRNWGCLVDAEGRTVFGPGEGCSGFDRTQYVGEWT